MSRSLTDSQVRHAARGRVLLVGAGPGDPDLLTVRAARILQSARIVAYDELVGAAILALVPEGAELISVGRRRGTCPQAPAIHPLVLERALEGRDVVRLKGGDPMIFGRGGEEAEQLAALRVPFEIIPGVSAALGAAAATGIPLTHRDVAPTVSFVTAHAKHDAHGDDLASRVPREGTVVLYMGLSTLRDNAALLIAAGRDPQTPCAVVSHATLPSQREVIATLATIADAVARADLAPPALVIIGEVVGKRVVPSARLPELREKEATSSPRHHLPSLRRR